MKRLFVWLLLGIVGVVLIAALIRSLVLEAMLQASVLSRVTQNGMTDARTVAAWSQERWDRAPEDIRTNLSALARVAGARIWLVDVAGVVRVDTESNPSWEGATISGEELNRALKGLESSVQDRSPWLDSALSCVVPVRQGDQIMGAVFLFLPASALPSEVASDPVLSTAFISLFIGAVAAYLIARRIALPVEQITAFARRLGRGEFPPPIAVHGFTEVSELGNTLSAVSQELQASFTTLAEERKRLAGIVQALQEGVVAVDGDERIILVNDRARRMLSWPDEKVTPQLLSGGTVPDQLRHALLRALAGETAELQLQPSGSMDLMAICIPVSAGDGHQGAVAVLRDVEPVMRLQRLRERFVADVAHELRGPLANVSLLVEALSDGTVEWDARQPYMATLKGEVDRLRRLSRDVLDLARLDAGIVTVEIESVPLLELAQQVMEQFRTRAVQAGVKLVADVPEDLYARASCGRMEQVLYNLVENALRHTPQGGAILVEGRQAGSRVRLTVADTGSGIPAEHLPHLFDRFYKVDPARTPGYGG
ncbi:MAG TPA: ATP-binding protein, partial [Symbiobacteriaceae bacterium]|nr:ATP-binding protein [Symbiobacteriaceae bacterium]